MSGYKDKYYNKQKFQSFEFTNSKWLKAQTTFKNLTVKHFRNGIIFGFLFEALITKTNIYENTVRKATFRRLENKRVEEENLKERYEKE